MNKNVTLLIKSYKIVNFFRYRLKQLYLDIENFGRLKRPSSWFLVQRV